MLVSSSNLSRSDGVIKVICDPSGVGDKGFRCCYTLLFKTWLIPRNVFFKVWIFTFLVDLEKGMISWQTSHYGKTCTRSVIYKERWTSGISWFHAMTWPTLGLRGGHRFHCSKWLQELIRNRSEHQKCLRKVINFWTRFTRSCVNFIHECICNEDFKSVTLQRLFLQRVGGSWTLSSFYSLDGWHGGLNMEDIPAPKLVVTILLVFFFFIWLVIFLRSTSFSSNGVTVVTKVSKSKEVQF